MKKSFQSYLIPSLLVLAMNSGVLAAKSFAQECVLPICEIEQTVQDFTSMKASKREAYITMLINGYSDNTDLESARNLLDFATKAAAIVKPDAETQKTVVEKIEALTNQSNQQIAIAAPISKETLTVFAKITSGTSRFRVIDFWGNNLKNVESIEGLKILRTLFADAKKAAITAKDPEYMVSLANSYEAATNNQLVEMGVAAEVKTIEDFKVLGNAERYTAIKAMLAKIDEKISATELEALIEFSARAAEVIATTDKTQLVINTSVEVKNLNRTATERLMRASGLTVEKMGETYRRLEGSIARYAAIQFWGAKIAELTDIETLSKLVTFFQNAASFSKEKQDDEYILAEIARLELSTNKQIISVTANAPKVELPIVDMTATVEKFTSMDLPSRALVIKALATAAADAKVEAKVLISINEFVKKATAVIETSGANQKFILEQAKELSASTTEALVRRSDLTATQLATYYKQLSSQTARFNAIRFWAPTVDAAQTKAEAQRLQKFFNLAKNASFSMDDEEYIRREAEINELRAKAAAATLK